MLLKQSLGLANRFCLKTPRQKHLVSTLLKKKSQGT